MNGWNAEPYLRLLQEKRLNGLIFGLFAGFWFGCGVWALDALLLRQAHADLPWLKLLLGLPVAVVFGGLAGWAAAFLEKPLLGALTWLVAGIAMVWFASHVPFQGVSFAIRLLDSSLTGVELYPFVEGALYRMFLLYVLSGLLFALGGGLQTLFVEGATRSSSQFKRFLILAMCIIFFLPVGLVVDNLINQSLRRPILAVNDMIQARLVEIESGGDRRSTSQISTRPLIPLENALNRPYRLILGSYDPITFNEATVYTDFSGEWGVCSVLINTPMVCWTSAERYLSRLECLVHSGAPGNCKLKLESDAGAPDKALFAEMTAEPLQFGILDQRGVSVVTIAEDAAGKQINCVFQDVGDIYLDVCRRVSGKAFDVQALPPTATRPAPTPSPTLPPLEGSAPEPEAALVEPEQADLAALAGAPRYDLSLQIAQDLQSFQGSARIAYTNNEDEPLDELYFRLFPNGKGSYGDGALNIQAVRLEGLPVEPRLSLSDTVLEAPLPQPLQPGERASLEFDFEGRVPLDFGGSATPEGYGIYNLADGVLALSGWYPILAVYDEDGWNLDAPSKIGDSVYSDTAFYSVEISYPDDLVLAATGVRTEQQEAPGLSIARFESGMARDFFIAASPEFETISKKVDRTIVNSYYLPGYEQAGSKALAVASKALEIYTDKFGAYPYRELDVVAAPMRNALGVEFPGIVLIGSKLYDDPGKSEFEITVAHEVAHQWWYSTVGNDVFDEPWLDEALATYSSGVYSEYAHGSDYWEGLLGYWQERYELLKTQGRDDRVTASLDYFERQPGSTSYGGVVYIKGALFFNALRKEIGDRAFFQALETYYRQHYFGIATAADLLSEFERAAGRGLSDFYDEWLYSPR
ncbi:MAG: hypothetical protein B6D39_06255 [Anaerolineae bacterium UTCFX2]|jgi:hypothetical protein|nr:MAG: hypothetical protein B6D39_06255 [Anaerolineae bacterium UTCFX2]